jgi:hypothetical protein
MTSWSDLLDLDVRPFCEEALLRLFCEEALRSEIHDKQKRRAFQNSARETWERQFRETSQIIKKTASKDQNFATLRHLSRTIISESSYFVGSSTLHNEKSVRG